MTTNPFIARFANEPALLAPGSESRFTSLLEAAAAHPAMAEIDTMERADGGDFWTELGDRASRILRPYVVTDGILQIPVRGVLLNDFPYALFDYATGYEYIWQAFKRGMEDSNVRGIALVINSPGGMVAGCFALVDRMFAMRGTKEVRAFASEHAYSAAYAIFSVADQGVVARTGGVGSIGVVTAHVDFSAAMEEAGIKVTFVHFGAHKVDGNPYEPLKPEVKARMQARIDELGMIFVDTVARNRALDADAVRATEALTYSAAESLSNGLADSIGEADDALAAFAADLSTPPEGDDEMSEQKDNSATAAPAAENTNAAAPPAVDTAQIARDAVAADRARRKEIMESDEAKDRQALAAHLADSTDMSPADAKGVLAKAAKETAPAASSESGTPFVDAMNADDHPNVGAANTNAATNDDDPDSAEAILAIARAAGVKGFSKPAA